MRSNRTRSRKASGIIYRHFERKGGNGTITLAPRARAGVRKPSQQRNSQADNPTHFIKPLLQHKQLYPSPFAIFLSVAICRKKSLIG